MGVIYNSLRVDDGRKRAEVFSREKKRKARAVVERGKKRRLISDTFSFLYFSSHFYFPTSGQAVVTGVVPFSPPVVAFNFYRA